MMFGSFLIKSVFLVEIINWQIVHLFNAEQFQKVFSISKCFFILNSQVYQSEMNQENRNHPSYFNRGNLIQKVLGHLMSMKGKLTRQATQVTFLRVGVEEGAQVIQIQSLQEGLCEKLEHRCQKVKCYQAAAVTCEGNS